MGCSTNIDSKSSIANTKNVLYILEWSGGLAARDKLRACVKAK